MNRRLAMLSGLAAALALAALVVPDADQADQDLVAAVPRATAAAQSAPRPVSAPAADRARASVAALASEGVAADPAARGAAAVRSTEVRRGESGAGVRQRTSLRASADLFPVPPPPPAATLVPAPPPSAPAAAPRPRFAMIGRMVDAAGPTAVMRDGDRVLTLRPGDRLSGFRMTAIGDEAASLVHEATGQTVRIAFGGAGGGAPGRAPPGPVAAAPVEEEAPSAD